MKLWNSWIAIGTPISIWEHVSDFFARGIRFLKRKTVSKFVFAKTQFVDFFRFKNRIPRKKNHYHVPKLILAYRSRFMNFKVSVFFLVFGRNSTFRKFSSYGPNPGPWALCRGCGGRSPPLVMHNFVHQQYICTDVYRKIWRESIDRSRKIKKKIIPAKP